MTTPTAPDGVAYRVLLIEDDPSIARVTMAFLAQAGFECHHAPNGALGVQSFRDTHPHLVLLDLMMPHISGEDVCRIIRAESTVPVIILTAKSGDEAQLEGFRLGADDYVIKPFELKSLLARVVAQLRRVYQYDAAQAATPQPAKSTTVKAPPGWAVCEDCNYIGPPAKFENPNRHQTARLICPNCKKSDYIVFAVES